MIKLNQRYEKLVLAMYQYDKVSSDNLKDKIDLGIQIDKLGAKLSDKEVCQAVSEYERYVCALKKDALLT